MTATVVPTFLPNKGQVLNTPEEFLLKQYSPHSRNMEFYNELLQGRSGLMKFSTTQLSGPIMLQDQFWEYSGGWSLMICTTKDIYKYDFSNLRFDILTPLYTTGTIEIQAGSQNIVRGSGTLWLANLDVGDFIKIGSGSVHTGSTWYQIKTVDSDTQLTLETNAVTTAAGAAYVARKCFTGTSTDYWKSVTFVDAILGTVWIATNGVDAPMRYTGTGQVQVLANLPTGFTSCKYLAVYRQRLIMAWTIEGGQNSPQRWRWSDVANCESYNDSDFDDITDDDYWFTGLVSFNDYLILFRERDAFVARWVGGTYIFQREKSSTCGGCWAPNSIVPCGGNIYYYGPDNLFKRWDLVREEVISDGLFDFTKDLDPNLEQYICGWQVEYKNQIRFFVPYSSTSYNNFCLTFDYINDQWYPWEYSQAQALNCFGEYLLIDDLYVDDPAWGELYVDEVDGFWDTRLFLSGAPAIIYGGYDGYIRIADVSTTDDGVAYTRTLRLSRDNYSLPNQRKRLWKQQYWLQAETAGSISLKVRLDDKVLFDADIKTISLIESDKDIIKKNVTWDKYAENFQLELYSENHFALLGFLSYVFPKRGTQ